VRIETNRPTPLIDIRR